METGSSVPERVKQGGGAKPWLSGEAAGGGGGARAPQLLRLVTFLQDLIAARLCCGNDSGLRIRNEAGAARFSGGPGRVRELGKSRCWRVRAIKKRRDGVPGGVRASTGP